MTAYDQALRRASGNVAHCDDAALMASFLEGSAQLLLGAVSPKLIWEGAQAQGLTAARVLELIHGNPEAARELMWAADARPRPRTRRVERLDPL
jgi:hypothetical protein